MTSTVLQNYEQLSYGGAASQWRGQHRQIISDVVASRYLTAKEAGSLCVYDASTTVTYYLPTPVAGMTFAFFTAVSVVATDVHVLRCSTGSFLLGALTVGSIATASAAGVAANGTTHLGMSSNGSTTGGLIGSYYTLTALSTTQWAIEGFLIGSSTLATPFTTT
jgi:hypothetical protein